MNLLKSLPFIIILLLSARLIWMNQTFDNMFVLEKEQGEIALSLQNSFDLQNKLTGLTLNDYNLIDTHNEVFSMTDIFSQNQYSIILMTSFSNCSACRDYEVELWAKAHEEEMPVYLVVTEDKPLEQRDIMTSEANALSLGAEFTMLLDPEGSILADLELKPKQTPVTLLVNQQGEVVAVNHGHFLTPQKSERFVKVNAALLKATYRSGS